MAVAMHNLIIALQPNGFVIRLCKKLIVDMDDLKPRVAKYMQMKELTNYQNQVRIETSTINIDFDKKVSEKEWMNHPKSKHDTIFVMPTILRLMSANST